MTATRSRVEHRSSSVPVSLVISLDMSLPSPFANALCFSRRVGKAKRAHRNITWWARRERLCPPYVLTSKLLHPWPQFQLPAPGAARLLQHVPVAQRDRV